MGYKLHDFLRIVSCFGGNYFLVFVVAYKLFFSLSTDIEVKENTKTVSFMCSPFSQHVQYVKLQKFGLVKHFYLMYTFLLWLFYLGL